MEHQHIVLAFVWILFCVTHSLLASVWFKNLVKNSSMFIYKYYRHFYITVALCFLCYVIIYQLNLPSNRLFLLSYSFKIFFCITGTIGVVVMVFSIIQYLFRGVALPQKNTPKLVTTGLNRFVRHPLYAGTLLALWSLFFLIPLTSLLISNTVVSVYTTIGIFLEEKKLVDEFGVEYLSYKQRVPMLLPFFKAAPPTILTSGKRENGDGD